MMNNHVGCSNFALSGTTTPARRVVRLLAAATLSDLQTSALLVLRDMADREPNKFAAHLARLGTTADGFLAEIASRKSNPVDPLDAVRIREFEKGLATRKRNCIEDERRRREDERRHSEWLVTPVGRQTKLVEHLSYALFEMNMHRETDSEGYRATLRRVKDERRLLDEMTGRRSPHSMTKLSGPLTVRSVFYGSDAGVTREYYRHLSGLGFNGRLGAQLMRVQKSSSRAKLYRGKHGGHAYNNKEKAMAALTVLLASSECCLQWGWGVDDSPRHTHPCRHVLYVDLPTGQVSFHAMARGIGPDYNGKWDGVLKASEGRVVAFAEMVEQGNHPKGCLDIDQQFECEK